MKVLIFSRYPQESGRPKGGVESVTAILAHALARLEDVAVDLVTLEPGIRSERVQHDGPLTIHRIPGSSWPQMFDVLAGPGRKRLLRKIGQLAPDVVHSHESYGLGLGGMPVPHLFTVHGFDHLNIPAGNSRFAWGRSLLWTMVERHGLSRQGAIVSISPYVRAIIEPLTRATIYEIDNPVDPEYFSLEREEEPGRVLCVGWISERKNTLSAVEAFAAAFKRGCARTLVIAGEPQRPAYLQRVEALIEQHGIRGSVELPGHVDRQRLARELSRASVMLLPSLQENAPMAIAEAMAAGVPVVASDRCGMPFMIEEGETGFLVDPTDTEQIADRLARILTSEDLRIRMQNRARVVASERFHPDAVARKTMEVYREISKNKGASKG